MPKPIVRYSLTVEQEDIEVRGNALASGDDEADKAAEDEILERLDRGDVWAWAFVQVIATLDVEGQTFTGRASLGCCNYRDEADFTAPDGYYPQMCEEATDELRSNVASAVRRGTVARKALRSLTVES